MPTQTRPFYKRSSTSQAPTTLNAIPPHTPDPTQAAHRADNLAACPELRDLGLALARAAAARALAAQEHTQTNPTPTPKPHEADTAFARHAHGVRQSVALWERVTNNAFARHTQPPNPWSNPDAFPLDADLAEALQDHTPPPYSEGDAGNLYEAVANLALISPHATIPETLPEIIAETLTTHPQDHLSTNFTRICQIFGITPDRTRLQPHLESQLRPPPDRYPQLE